jgi:hypothetical protein
MAIDLTSCSNSSSERAKVAFACCNTIQMRFAFSHKPTKSTYRCSCNQECTKLVGSKQH